MRILIVFLTVIMAMGAQSAEPAISLWYGEYQQFGHLGGHPQRWINILGNISNAGAVVSAKFSLNGLKSRALSFLEDKKRLAQDGDFNVEIARSELRPGRNTVTITANYDNGTVRSRTMTLDYMDAEQSWPLPYTIDWSKVQKITDAAQVVDGKWELTEGGVRSAARYYDRVIAFGDASWRNYEVTTTVTVHALTPPKQDPNTTGVTHTAIALRWPGHDADGLQPSVKWHPLGATAEFRLGGDLQACRWRIFDGKKAFHVESQRRRTLEFEKPYRMKHQVATLADGQSRYRVKLWPAAEPEPAAWDLQRFEIDDLESGSALLIAHHADVTFGNVRVTPLR